MKEKLLLTINSLRSGGAERVVSQLLEHLKDDVEIHLVLYNHIIEYDIPPGIKIVDLNQSENEGQVSMLLKLPWLSYKVSRYCKRNGIRYSVAFLNRPCYINALMRTIWGFRGRVVMCERTHQTTMLQTKSAMTRLVTKLLIRASYNRADLVLANAEAIKTDLREKLHVKKPIEVIYNPVDLRELQARMKDPVNLQLVPGRFYFIAVGNFRKEKNFPLLIDAFAQLKDLDCGLLLIGDGLLEDVLRQKVSAYGITDKVIFGGRDNNPFKYMNRCDAFVLCSDVEGFPNVLLEALACGKPAISTDCLSGPRELLAPSTDLSVQLTTDFKEEAYGILTPVGNATIMASAMRLLVTDEAIRNRLASKAVKRAGEFDVSVIRQYFLKAFLG